MEAVSKTGFSGRYHFEHIRGGVVIDAWDDENIVPTQGLNFILNVLSQAAVSKKDAWYMGLGTGSWTALSSDTGANIVTNASETILYDGARKLVVGTEVTPASTAASLTNAASKATFTANASVTITNAFVLSTSPKGDATGTILSSLKLGTSKALVSADQLVVTFTLSATSV